MRGRVDMQPSEPVESGQSTPVGRPRYEPPQVEVLVTPAELEREALYAGGGAGYAVP